MCICIATDVSLTFRGKLNYRWKELGNRKHLLEESGFKKLRLTNKSQLPNDLKLFVVLVRSLPPSSLPLARTGKRMKFFYTCKGAMSRKYFRKPHFPCVSHAISIEMLEYFKNPSQTSQCPPQQEGMLPW